jgi:hypothetical protein
MWRRRDVVVTFNEVVDQAIEMLRQTLSIACRQQAKTLKLRAATSLARLWQSQDKRQEAYNLLAPVYN